MKQSIQEIKQEFAKAGPNQWPALCVKYEEDDRAGVKNLVASCRKKMQAIEDERIRLRDMSRYEEDARMRIDRDDPSGVLVCGIDEVGRGPLAGPVVAAAVILPHDAEILYLNDSKKLSTKKRAELDTEIREKAIAIGIGIVDEKRIDEINILNATYEAMRMAISGLKVAPDILLNDAVTIPEVEIPQVPIIHGDAKSVSIAAASVVAKVYRDKLMEDYDKVYPGYGFADNKGYGSAGHIEHLKSHGACPIHRRSFLGNILA